MRHGLQSGLLPDGCSFITKQLSTFRRATEAAVLSQRGCLGVYETACVQTACEWYSHCLKARRWLRIAFDELSHDQRIAFSREAARALSERDRVLKNLGLDATGDDRSTIYTFAGLDDADDDDNEGANDTDDGTADDAPPATDGEPA
jgi:hypothetical protein